MPNFRSTPAIDRQLAELMAAGYGNRTQVINAAIAYFHHDTLGNGAQREMQVWRHVGGAYYLVVRQGALIAAHGPLPLEEALPIAQGRSPEPEQWGAALGNWASAMQDAGRMAQVWPVEEEQA